jgi:hypothetical protein
MKQIAIRMAIGRILKDFRESCATAPAGTTVDNGVPLVESSTYVKQPSFDKLLACIKDNFPDLGAKMDALQDLSAKYRDQGGAVITIDEKTPQSPWNTFFSKPWNGEKETLYCANDLYGVAVSLCGVKAKQVQYLMFSYLAASEDTEKTTIGVATHYRL